MLTLLLALSPFALFGMFALAVIFYEECDIIRKPIKPETAEDRIKRYGYDPLSPMVQQFQKLAGIRNSYGRMYSTTSHSLRDQFNRARVTCTNIV